MNLDYAQPRQIDMSLDRSATRPGLPARFVRFLLVGGFATVLMYVLLVIGTEVLGIVPVISSVLAYVLSALANYGLGRKPGPGTAEQTIGMPHAKFLMKGERDRLGAESGAAVRGSQCFWTRSLKGGVNFQVNLAAPLCGLALA